MRARDRPLEILCLKVICSSSAFKQLPGVCPALMPWEPDRLGSAFRGLAVPLGGHTRGRLAGLKVQSALGGSDGTGPQGARAPVLGAFLQMLLELRGKSGLRGPAVVHRTAGSWRAGSLCKGSFSGRSGALGCEKAQGSPRLPQGQVRAGVQPRVLTFSSCLSHFPWRHSPL